MYDSILARSFSRHEQKKLGWGAIICSIIIALFFCSFVKPYFGPIPNLNLQLSMGAGLKMLAVRAAKTSQQMIGRSAFHGRNYYLQRKEPSNASDRLQEGESNGNVVNNGVLIENSIKNNVLIREAVKKITEPRVMCTTNGPRTEFCEIKTEARVDGKSSSVFVDGETSSNTTIIRPYARKGDSAAMDQVRKWSVQQISEKGTGETAEKCTKSHTVPAILFSLGGYAGNNFHDFTDVIVPLFITSRKFNREVQFLISDSKYYFLEKFDKILKGLSKYEPILIDNEDGKVHCFPSAIIGLNRTPRELTIDQEKHSTSMKEFRDFLRETYSLNRVNSIRIRDNLRSKKPHLLILSRLETRTFTNIGKIVAMARSLGYKVTVAEASTDLARVSRAINSCDVLMGVHGAGLANMVFLPENAVLVQIVPVGGFDWLAKTDFESPSKDMNLRYLEYKISNVESTLIEKYPLDHTVFTDPYSIQKQGWEEFRSIFLDNQNVKLDVHRFKPTLAKALELLRA